MSKKLIQVNSLEITDIQKIIQNKKSSEWMVIFCNSIGDFDDSTCWSEI